MTPRSLTKLLSWVRKKLVTVVARILPTTLVVVPTKIIQPSTEPTRLGAWHKSKSKHRQPLIKGTTK